jgi:hypothetical protein
MPKFNPDNPAHVRARVAIQGWLWKLHEAGLEVIDAEELERLKRRVIHLEAELEVTDKLYQAQAQEVTTVARCEGCGEDATVISISAVGKDNVSVHTPDLCNRCFTKLMKAVTQNIRAGLAPSPAAAATTTKQKVVGRQRKKNNA